MTTYFERRDYDWYYTGPLEPAKAEAARFDTKPTISKSEDGRLYAVEAQHDFGYGYTEDDAWRYYLGAALGPGPDEDNDFDVVNNYIHRLLTVDN